MAQSTTNLGKIHVFPSEALYNQFKDIIADNDLALLKDDGAYIVAALLEQNGYVKFSNGLILQWGVVYIGLDSEKNIFFNVSFSSICYGGLSTNAHTLHLSSDAGTSFYNITQSTAKISHTSNYAGNVFWLAIGV